MIRLSVKVSEIINTIEQYYPRSLAESWDNPGLLCGRKEQEVNSIVLALDASQRVVNYAVDIGADMILTHHPIIFDGIRSVTDDTFTGRKLLQMIENRISCYAMHTNFDIAQNGMAYAAAKRLGVREFVPLEQTSEQDGVPVGIGFVGDLPKAVTAGELASFVKEKFGISSLFYYDSGKLIRRVAVCPGSGRHMLDAVRAAGADAFITGDTGHHDGMDYKDDGITLIDAGHFGVEHIFTEHMKYFLETRFPDLKLYEEVTDERRYV